MGPVGIAAAAALGVATVAVGAFAKAAMDGAVRAVDFAGKISDLSTKTGISAVALQKLGFAGSTVGTSMEDVASAVSKLQQHIVKAPEDFKQLGLSIEHLKTLAPEKQFEAVGQAILRIHDPAQRTAATFALLGKGGAEALKILSQNLDDTSAQAERLGLVMSDQTREALDALGDSVGTLGKVWDGLFEAIGGAIAETPEVRAAVEAITEAIGELSVYVQENGEEIQELVAAAIVPMADAMVNLLHGVQFVVSAFLQWKRAIDDVRAAAQGTWVADLASAAASALGFHGSNGSANIPARTGNKLSATAKVGGTVNGRWVDPAELKKMEAAAEKAQKAWQDAAEKARADWEKFNAAVRKMAEEQAHGIQTLLSKRAAATTEALDAMLKEELDANDQLEEQLARQQEIREENAARAAQNRKANREAEIMAVAQAFGDVSNIFGQIDGALAALGVSADSVLSRIATSFQDVAGAAANFVSSLASGNLLQKIGAGLGLVGAAIGGIKKIFGGGEHAKVNDMRDQFVAAAGGITELDKRARAAGLTVDKLLSAKKVKDFEAAVAELNAAFGLQGQANEKLNEAIQKYGFSIEELGPKFRQQELDKLAAQLIGDYQLLTASGIDHNLVIEKMGPNLNEYVQTAMKAGISIPENMRPMLQKMLEMGVLTDEAGNKLETLDGLSFTESLTEGLGRAIDAINRLVAALGGIPAEVNTRVNVSGGGEGGGHEPPPKPGGEFAGGANLLYFPPRRGGHSVTLAEKGEGEFLTVTPASKMGAGGGAPINYNVTVNVAGDGDAKKIERHVKDALRNNGEFRDEHRRNVGRR